jgi:hypothetical protein
MSSETPAAHLARIKVTYGDWSICAVELDKGVGFAARRRNKHPGVRSVYAPTLGELESALAELENWPRRRAR